VPLRFHHLVNDAEREAEGTGPPPARTVRWAGLRPPSADRLPKARAPAPDTLHVSTGKGRKSVGATAGAFVSVGGMGHCEPWATSSHHELVAVPEAQTENPGPREETKGR
jgi:hypothetical protein